MPIENVFRNVQASHGPRQLMYWPDNEAYSRCLMQLLSMAEEGVSTVSECMRTARAIGSGDHDVWYREWKNTAQRCKRRGDTAFQTGSIKTACRNWLRASRYYRTAELFLTIDDGRRERILDQMEICARLYLLHSDPKGEIVIADIDGKKMSGYFLGAAGARVESPVVVCIGGPDHVKEDHLCRLPRYARARGVSLLLIDLPGQGAHWRRKQAAQPKELERSVSSWVDYLVARPDVDIRRIAIFGDGLGACFASRAAAHDDRFSAAVCDGGIWDLYERAFLLQRPRERNTGDSIKHQLPKLWPHAIAKRIRCPILIALGKHDGLEMDHASEFYDYLEQSGVDISRRILPTGETNAAQLQDDATDNPTIAIEFVFDWLTSRIGSINGTESGAGEAGIRRRARDIDNAIGTK